MTLNPKAFGLAAALTAAVAFTACALFVALAPGIATAVFSDVTHLNLEGLSRTLTWATYFEGVVFWAVWTGLVFGFAGLVYNRVSRDEPGVGATVRPAGQHA